MGFKKNGIVNASGFNEMDLIKDMKLKILDDGSVWGRIHWLDVTTINQYFTNNDEVNKCTNQSNRYSRMGIVDSFKSNKVILKNLVPGPEEWLTYKKSSTLDIVNDRSKYGTHSIKITGSSGVETTSTSWKSIPYISGHTYYARYEAYQDTLVGGCGFYWPITGNGSFWNGSALGTAKQWVLKSAVKNVLNETSRNATFRLDFDNGGSAGNIWFDGIMIIDLTDAFGSGNEPTKTWCDANIPYFSGVKTINMPDTTYGRYEFLLTFPKLSGILYNRWSQTSSPNATSVAGLIRITTASGWTTAYDGIRKHGSNCVYNCDTGDTWYAPIGQKSAWDATRKIPGANGSAQTETELWVRLDLIQHTQSNNFKIFNNEYITASEFIEI